MIRILYIIRAWGVPDGVDLIGIVARLDPNKDHATFLRAAARLAVMLPHTRFVSVGAGTATRLTSLQRLATELGIADRVLWKGSSNTMVGVYNALSLLTSTSLSNGFSNVLGEAMACGVPCVATDVGDSARVLGDPVSVVPRGTPQALAQACHRWLTADPAIRHDITGRGRERVLRCFSLRALVDQHTLRYEHLLPRHSQPVLDAEP